MRIGELVAPADVQQRLMDIATTGKRSLDDEALLAELPADRRVATLRRLLAVLLGEVDRDARARFLEMVLGPSGRDMDPNDLGGIAGVGRSVLGDLRRRWRADPRIEVMIPYAPGTARSKTTYPEVEKAVREELAARPDASTESIALAVIARSDTHRPQARVTVRRIVEEQREALRISAPRLEADFAKAFIVDHVPMELPVAVSRSDPEWPGLSIVIEAASGLILGWSLDLRRHSVGSFEMALASAAAEMKRLGLRSPQAAATFNVNLPPDDDQPIDFLNLRRRIGEASNVSFRDTGRWRLGRDAQPMLRARLGRYRLRPRKHSGRDVRLSEDELAEHPVLKLDQAIVAVGREVREHNEPILKRLRQLALIGHASEGSSDAGATLMALSGLPTTAIP